MQRYALANAFQSTLPVGGATACIQHTCHKVSISIHAPRGGSDHRRSAHRFLLWYFNPRSPWGERPQIGENGIIEVEISIHAPRGGSDDAVQSLEDDIDISIHAPRGGSDSISGHLLFLCAISIHAPRGGSDVLVLRLRMLTFNFNPRSPWGERPSSSTGGARDNNFNPRSPWGERLRFSALPFRAYAFQSTLPVGGATSFFRFALPRLCISIHAPRGGSDRRRRRRKSPLWYFNPRSPWGERL